MCLVNSLLICIEMLLNIPSKCIYRTIYFGPFSKSTLHSGPMILQMLQPTLVSSSMRNPAFTA